VADKTFRCRLITPEARLLDQDATHVSLPFHDGLAGVLPRHAPIVAKLGLGELRVDFPEGGSRSYFLDGGFGQFVGDHLTILAEEAIPAEALIESQAKAELDEANARTGSTGEELTKVVHDRSRAALKARLAARAKAQGV
jgi:F-type H+-transporting ATPase subunit epsilon